MPKGRMAQIPIQFCTPAMTGKEWDARQPVQLFSSMWPWLRNNLRQFTLQLGRTRTRRIKASGKGDILDRVLVSPAFEHTSIEQAEVSRVSRVCHGADGPHVLRSSSFLHWG